MLTTLTVNSLQDNMTASDGYVTLREAVYAANNDTETDLNETGSGADTIVFHESLFAGGPATITVAEKIDVSTDLSIEGPGADLLAVSGGDLTRVFEDFLNVNVTLSGISIIDGFASDEGGPDSRGGGVYNGLGHLVVDGVEFRGNTANTNGGAIYSVGGSLTVLNSTFHDNAAASGGAIYATSGTLSILNSTFDENEAGSGGAVYTNSGTVSTPGQIINSTFSGNHSDSSGGAMATGAAAYLEIIHSTITANSSDTSGGGVYAGNTSHRVTLHNSIVVGNTGSGGAANDLGGNVAGYSASSSYNLIGAENSNDISNNEDGNQTGVADAGLASLADNGGPTKTHALSPDSLAINAGDSDIATGAGLLLDQRGSGYERILGETVDIGATEAWLQGDYAGILEIYSGSGSDTILVSSTDISHSAFGELEVDLSEVDEVRVYGYGGDDYLAVDAAFASIAKLYGGDGNDELRGGAAADLLFGEAGDDKLFGYGGDDALDGGEGNDFLQGDAGSDAYVGGAGHDFYEPDGEDDPHAPELDPIDDLTVRRDEGIAFRVIADDLEDDYNELDFDVTIDTQVIPSNWYSIVDGVFRLLKNLWDADTYEVSITVADQSQPQPLTDQTTFDITLEAYNFAPPELGFPYTPPPIYGAVGLSVNGEVEDPSEISDFFGGSDTQTLFEDLSFEGVLDSSGFFTVDFQDYVAEGERLVATVTDEAVGTAGPRTRKRALYVEVPNIIDLTNESLVFVGQGLAVDDAFGTEVNTSVPIDLGWNDVLYTASLAFVIDGPKLPVYPEPQLQNGTFENFNPDDGTFTYVPNPGFEGLETFTYTVTHPGIHYNDGITQADPGGTWVDRTETLTTNAATVTIEVGKAVRANLTIEGLDEEDEDQGGGRYLDLNSDDDNVNSIQDRQELIGPIRGEDDLVRVDVDYWLRDDVTEEDFTARFILASSLYGAVRLWTTADKEKEIIPYLSGDPDYWGEDFLLADLPSEIYVEGTDFGTGSLGLDISAPQSTLFSNYEGVTPLDVFASTDDLDTVNLTVLNLDLDVDTNRDNDITDMDDTDEDKWSLNGPNGKGAIILLNADDDDSDNVPDNWWGGDLDGDGNPDAADDEVNGSGDIADVTLNPATGEGPLWLHKLGLGSLPDTLETTLKVEQVPGEDQYWKNRTEHDAPEERIRIFRPSLVDGDDLVIQAGDTEIIGPSTGSEYTFSYNPGMPDHFDIFEGTGVVKFGIEGLHAGAPVLITTIVEVDGNEVATDTVQVKVSPWIAFSHKQDVDANGSLATTVWVSDLGADPLTGNEDLRSKLDSFFGSRVEEVPLTTVGDKWWQDGFEIGYVQAPYGQMPAILLLPRSRSGGNTDFYDYARETMMIDGVGLITQFAFGAFNDQNDGGNFEVQPEVGGPLGTIVIAEGPNNSAMNTEIVKFLEAQGVQDVISNLNLSWMVLGHTDEVVSFQSDSGNRARVASPEAAWALLVIAKEVYGKGSESMLQDLNLLGAGGRTVNNILADATLRGDNFDIGGYSDNILEYVRDSLGLIAPVSTPTTVGAPNGTLRRAGYLDVFDTISTYGDEIEWKLVFTTANDYTIWHREAGTTTWVADGAGSRDEDSFATSQAIYILLNWWDPTKATDAGDEIHFTTKPSPNMIEMPVLFADMSYVDPLWPAGAVAYTNNVINSIVHGSKLLVADVAGPDVEAGIGDIFDYYVREAAELVGFITVENTIETAYHNGIGSIHCGTNLIRVIEVNWWENL